MTKMTTIQIGGYHPDPTRGKWPSGSIWESEGQRLYELVREHKPKLVVEVGAYYGCSTTWISQALIDNGHGKLISIDKGVFGERWSMVPEENKKVIEFRAEDCFETEVPENIDLLFEDGMHSPGFTEAVLARFPAKIVVCHDYSHPTVGKHIKDGFHKVVGEPDEVFMCDETDCGLAIKYVRGGNS